MPVPIPTPVYRFIHIDNLEICLKRGGIHSPNDNPKNGLNYKTIHNIEIQTERRITRIPCGPGGVIHDYVAFYFGYLSPMLLQLKTGRVEGYSEGQEPLIYLVSSVQRIQGSGTQFVFSDGHGIAAYTDWYDDLKFLDRIDWSMVYQRYWKDTVDDMDRQRRKQAEFLAHRFCDWTLIEEIGVMNDRTKRLVEDVLRM
ncbi:DUF4433 domain-containing protein [bacterium]|nr:DUF4433 domain-containing protein [bacterium]